MTENFAQGKVSVWACISSKDLLPSRRDGSAFNMLSLHMRPKLGFQHTQIRHLTPTLGHLTASSCLDTTHTHNVKIFCKPSKLPTASAPCYTLKMYIFVSPACCVLLSSTACSVNKFVCFCPINPLIANLFQPI